MAVQDLGWALVTTGVLGIALWALSRLVYHLGVLPLAQALSRPLGGMRWPYFAFLLPGTVVHEFSHWLACKLTLVKVVEFVPFSPRPDGTLGWVLHERAGPLRSQIISLAPLAGGTAVLYLGARLLMPGLLELAMPGETYTSPAESLWSAGVFWATALVGADYGRWGTWLYLYLAFAVGRGMVPSQPDLWQLLGAWAILSGVGFLVGLADAWQHWGLLRHPLAIQAAGGALPLVSVLNALLAFGLVAVSLGAAVLIPLGLALQRLGSTPRPQPRPARRRGMASARKG